jgi:SWIM zinc finger
MVNQSQVGKPEKRGSGWRVPSASGPGAHFVRLVPRPQCTCSFWVFGHGAPCRHIRAVKALLDKEREVGIEG